MEGETSFEDLSSFYENSDETQYCDECDRSYTQIKVHKALAHRGKEQKICNICGLQFSKNKHLVNHLTEHRRNRIKCHFCKRKDFNSVTIFLKHLEEHESLHVFVCSFCSKSFTVRQHFNKHMKKKHEVSCLTQGNNETLLTQNSVEIDNSVDAIDRRERSPRQLDTNELNDKFLCFFCHKYFPDKQLFDRHMKRKHNSRSINQSKNETLSSQKSSDNVNELEQSAKHSQEHESSFAVNKHRKRKYSSSILDQSKIDKNATEMECSSINRVSSPIDDFNQSSNYNRKEKNFKEEQKNSQGHKVSLNESKDEVNLISDKPNSQKGNSKIKHEFLDPVLATMIKDMTKLQNCGARKSLWDRSNDLSDEEFVDDDDDDHSSDEDDIVDRTCFKCKLVVNGRGPNAISCHFVLEHNEGSKQCKTCGKNLKSPCYVYFHALKHAGAEPWNCVICNMKFVSKAVYKRHLTKVHKKEKCYQCEHCNEKFIYWLSYHAHLLGHSDQFQFSCEFCMKKFRYKNHLSMHQEKMLCQQCDMILACKTSFENHLADFHYLDACYDCPHCDRSFDKSNKLNLHMTLKHVDELKRNIIYCQSCDYATHNTYNMTRHVRARHSLP